MNSNPSKKLKIGILTGGGDAPGLNGVIEAASRTLLNHGVEVYGIRDGFEGVFQKNSFLITHDIVDGLHNQAGTILGTSNKSKIEGRSDEFQNAFRLLGLDGIIAAGGDGTFMGLKKLAPDLKIVGVPKTIDNDLQGTESTFGFDTASTVVAESVDALRATAQAHRRILIVEAMGRSAGWIALSGGLAGYADGILIPERPYDPKLLQKFLTEQFQKNVTGMVFSVSEAAHAIGEDPVFVENKKGGLHTVRFGGIGERLISWIESNTPWEARAVVLGHLQRSRSPTTFDRHLTLGLGVTAAHLVLKQEWNTAVVFQNGKVCSAPLSDLQGEPRMIPVNHPWISAAKDLGIFI
jgi:6-phosphofructokinase